MLTFNNECFKANIQQPIFNSQYSTTYKTSPYLGPVGPTPEMVGKLSDALIPLLKIFDELGVVPSMPPSIDSASGSMDTDLVLDSVHATPGPLLVRSSKDE